MISVCDQVAKEKAAEAPSPNKMVCKMKSELLHFPGHWLIITQIPRLIKGA